MIDQNKLNEVLLKYDFALSLIETNLSILIKDYEFKNKYNLVEHIKSRIKTEKSIKEKLTKKGYDFTVENIKKHIHDMIGVRIVCSFICDVEKVVELIKNSKLFEISDEKDYIKSPKDTGYQSIHLIINVPIYLNERV